VLVDTHCHLGDPAFAGDVALVVERADQAGVGHVVVIGESRAAADRAMALAAEHAHLSATAGVHPHTASDWSAGTAAWLTETVRDPRIVAVGEMGLDYHYDHSPRETQQRAFDAQLAIAASAGKPAVIHAREADDDVAAMLRRHPRTVAILHSWSSGPALLETALALRHYVSFSGMVTFKSWSQDDALRTVPLDRLLMETDAPYLAPVPYRGKRNEPAYLPHTCAAVARWRDEDPQAVGALCARNARAFYRLDAAQHHGRTV
jgi:TatD DNase family protein